MAFGDVAFQICENGVFKEKNVRLNSAGCEPHSRSDECFLFENPIFTLLKRHVRKRHVYRLPIGSPWHPHVHRRWHLHACMSGWRNTAEIVLFEISNSLKPYPSFFRAYIGKSRPVIGFSEQKQLIEVSNRIPPTSHCWR